MKEILFVSVLVAVNPFLLPGFRLEGGMTGIETARLVVFMSLVAVCDIFKRADCEGE